MVSTLSREQQMWRWRIFISTYMGYIGYYLTRKTFTICKTTIAEDLNWELSDTAYIWAAFLFAYMVGQFISGFVGRKWGPRLLLLSGLGMSIACNLVFGVTNSFWTFLVFMFVNGLVQATGWPGSVGAVSQWIRNHERGTIMGWWATSYMFGNLIFKYIGALLLAHWGWRSAFAGLTGMTLFIWWLLYFWQRNTPQDAGIEPIVDSSEDHTRAISAERGEHLSFRQYLGIAFHPLVLTMGVSYLSIKFLRYALDSWLPAFLNLQGFSVASAARWSMWFDIAGLAGTIVAGWALDRIFRGNWAILSFVMAIGTIIGYIAVLNAGGNPILVALCFGIVGFMLYGPDTLLTGAAAIAVAGEANGVAVAGIVNAIGSAGPVIQELLIGKMMEGTDMTQNIHNANMLTLGMSVVFALLMIVVAWRLHMAHRDNARKRAEGEVQ